MSYLVTVNNSAVIFFLRGTVWSFSSERADKFATREAAQAALEKARKFMKPAIYRKAAIQESHFYDIAPAQ